MDRPEIVRRAFEVFREDASLPPPLTLRGGDRVDSYDYPEPFDAELDAPTDEYIERYAFHAMPFLDARSWRHYLPRLIDHVFRRPDEPTGLVAFAVIHSLRPPDREPARLATLVAEQEAVIVAFLEELVRTPVDDEQREDARQALDEWWLPNARLRPMPHEIEAKRRAPVAYHEVGSGNYRLTVPSTFVGTGLREIPSESRRVEYWSGHLVGDVPARALVHFEALRERTLNQVIGRVALQFVGEHRTQPFDGLSGAKRAQRLDGMMHGYSHSPAELERAIIVLAIVERELLTFRVTSWDRPDVVPEMEKIVASFRLA